MLYPYLRKAGVELTRLYPSTAIYGYTSKQIANALNRLEVRKLSKAELALSGSDGVATPSDVTTLAGVAKLPSPNSLLQGTISRCT